MKVFYWTDPIADAGNRCLYQADTKTNYVNQPPYPSREDIVAMLEDGFVEISVHTAYKLGLPA